MNGKRIGRIMPTFFLLSMLVIAFRATPILKTATADATVTVDVLIDYGNRTRTWHLGVVLPFGATVFNATLAVATTNYTYWPEYEATFIDAINEVWNEFPYYWIWWHWDHTESKWIVGPVGCDRALLKDGDVIAWYYQDVSVFAPPPPLPVVISATVEIDPETLYLKSEGKWISTYIELPKVYNLNDIDISTIELNYTVSVDISAPTQIGDYDSDGVSDIMVKFNRTEVTSFIYATGTGFGEITLIMTGILKDNLLKGSDVIRVVS